MRRSYHARSARTLFEPTYAGSLKLNNRIVMAPLTRNRAGPGLVPGPLASEYYAQRAFAGLIIAEATQVSAQAQGYADTPGCYTAEQIRGWKTITDAVHVKGGSGRSALAHGPCLAHKLSEGLLTAGGSFRHPRKDQDFRGRPGLRRRIDAARPPTR